MREGERGMIAERWSKDMCRHSLQLHSKQSYSLEQQSNTAVVYYIRKYDLRFYGCAREHVFIWK